MPDELEARAGEATLCRSTKTVRGRGRLRFCGGALLTPLLQLFHLIASSLQSSDQAVIANEVA
jgi:hypothetical protein